MHIIVNKLVSLLKKFLHILHIVNKLVSLSKKYLIKMSFLK